MYKSVIKVILLGCLLINTTSVFADVEYVKVSNSGKSLESTAKLGTGPNDWACIYDTKKKLLWEVKTNDGGMRDKSWTYIWYDPTSAKGVYTGVEENLFNSFNCKAGKLCNTDTFVRQVNSAGLCGSAKWELPSDVQLKTLQYCVRESPGRLCQQPTIETEFFPNTETTQFWTSKSQTYDSYAWFVSFKYLTVSGHDKDVGHAVRLVVRNGKTFIPVIDPNEKPKSDFDSQPDKFTFTDRSNVDPNTEIVSNSIPVKGINTKATISIQNGKYQIGEVLNKNGSWIDYESTVNEGDKVWLHHQSSNNFSQSITTTLKIGGVEGQFTSTTKESDTTLDAFSFKEHTGADLNTLITSEPIPVSGLADNVVVAISIENGEYQIKGSDRWWKDEDEDGEVKNGDEVTVKHTSSDSSSSSVTTTLTIDGVSEKFTSTTKFVAGDSTGGIGSFDFADRSKSKSKEDNVSSGDVGLINGKIFDACSGDPLDQAEFNFSGPGSEFVQSKTNGTYTAELAIGEYEVTVSDNDGNYEESTFNIIITEDITSIADISLLPSSGCLEDKLTVKAIILEGIVLEQTPLSVVMRDDNELKKAWVKILSPNNKFSEISAIDGLPNVELDCQADRCEGLYDNLSVNGTYLLNFFGEDNSGEVSLLRTVELKVTEAEELEQIEADIIYNANGLVIQDVEVAGLQYYVALEDQGDLKFKVKDYFQLPESVGQHVSLSDDGTLSLPRVYLYDSDQYYSIDLKNIGDLVFEAQLETLKVVD